MPVSALPQVIQDFLGRHKPAIKGSDQLHTLAKFWMNDAVAHESIGKMNISYAQSAGILEAADAFLCKVFQETSNFIPVCRGEPIVYVRLGRIVVWLLGTHGKRVQLVEHEVPDISDLGLTEITPEQLVPFDMPT